MFALFGIEVMIGVSWGRAVGSGVHGRSGVKESIVHVIRDEGGGEFAKVLF